MKSIIIDRLIKIEENAREITREADEQEAALLTVIRKETEELERALKAEYEQKSAAVISEKQGESEREIKKLEDSFLQKSKLMEQFFEQNEKAWENEIFDAIIGGGSWR